MTINSILFGASMAGSFALSVVATLYLVPVPTGDNADAIYLLCVAVALFSAGVLGYGAGVIREAKKIEARILADLRKEWDERVFRLPPASEVAAGLAAERVPGK